MRIAIVNDMPMAIEGMRRVVMGSGKHELVWTARNGREAVEQCQRQVPELILMDLIMPEMDGVEATRQIMRATPCPILIVTASVNQNTAMVFEAMGAGALDAVNTPILAAVGEGQGPDPLLRKIDIIGILTRSSSAKVAHRDFAPVTAVECSCTKEELLVIGSSSGGPQVLTRILRELPKDFPAPVVLVQHVDAQFAPGMADWLDQQTALTVRLAQEGDCPTAGTVLLAGTNNHLILKGSGALGYTADPIELPYRPSVDVFWHSLASHWHGKIVAVLLTGMGRDGAQGMLELRRKGAYTIAQDEATSAVYGMPKAAKELDAALEILPIETISILLRSKFPLQPQQGIR